jgi:titin
MMFRIRPLTIYTAMAMMLCLSVFGPRPAHAALNITLLWSDATGETNYRIEKQVDGGAFGTVTTVAADLTSYNDTDLPQGMGHTYCYKVVPFNNFGDQISPAPNTLCTTPNVPTGSVLISVIAAP